MMRSGEEEPKKALTAIDGETAGDVRREVLEILCDTVGADGGLFCKYRKSEEESNLINVEVSGAGALPEVLETLSSQEAIAAAFWDPRYPPRDAIGVFRQNEVNRLNPDSLRMQRLREIVYKPAGVHHEANALLYNGSQFVGWVALFRTYDEPFADGELETLNGLIDLVVDVFAEAEEMDRELLGERPAYFLLSPQDCLIKVATGNASEWLNERRHDSLVSHVRGISGQDCLPLKSYLDGYRIWLNWMQGDLGQHYIATVEHSEPTKLAPESVLTPRQREVVDYAAAGATNKEIAETLGISPDTVSDHLSESYERLGVANRVELALKLTQES